MQSMAAQKLFSQPDYVRLYQLFCIGLTDWLGIVDSDLTAVAIIFGIFAGFWADMSGYCQQFSSIWQDLAIFR